MEPSNQSATGHPAGAVSAPQHLPLPRPCADGALGPSSRPAPAADDVPPRHHWPRTAAVALVATAVALAAALLVHAAMLFLTLAPPNALKVRHQGLITSYVQPEFGQDWKLFAPNPKQRNDAIGVRLRTTGDDGRRRVSEWINLTAHDVAAIQGDPAPSHVHQNMLRNAWDNSESWQGPNNRPKGIRGAVAAAYLKRVALQRVGRQWKGERITQIQIAGRYEMVSPPPWSAEKASDTTTYRILPWWPVTDQDYKGL
jgi:hypothetical protein